MAPIVIGPRSNVQDGAVLHGDPGQAVMIGSDVTVGHRAVVHGCTLQDGCLVGIGAIVLNGVTVGQDPLWLPELLSPAMYRLALLLLGCQQRSKES